MFFLSPLNALDNAEVVEPIITTERTILGYILNWIRLVGTGVALIMLTVMAIRYFTAPPGPKADLKKAFHGYISGAMILIGATNIIYFVEQLIEDILKDATG